MNKLILSLVCSFTIMGAEHAATIIDYNETHKDAILDIASQDAHNFFFGYQLVTKGLVTADAFKQQNLAEFTTSLNNPLRIKKVVIVSGKVVGFVVFFRTKEMSLETAKRNCEARGVPFNEQIITSMMPNIKKTDAECEYFAKIEGIAVSRDFRKKGHGKALIQAAFATIKQEWPMVKKTVLEVTISNEPAQKLYESQGFIKSKLQPAHAFMMEIIQYEKEIK